MPRSLTTQPAKRNTATGTSALLHNTAGNLNTATGGQALFFNTTGFFNTATGFDALGSNISGHDNTANGVGALESNTHGFQNTAIGVDALANSRNASNNTATGFEALLFNTGNNNTATGAFALVGNTTGSRNTACGEEALSSNTSGFNNTAIGMRALNSATTAHGNTATGAGALLSDNTGQSNTANGQNALSNNTSGSSNIALGINAGRALTTGSNNIDIGNAGVMGESGTIRIGTAGTHTATFIAGISGNTLARGVAVFVNANGELGTMLSSARFKEAIKPMDKASEAILALQPVTFRYKPELDAEGIPQFGLIAEDVEKVNPDLVVRDENGDLSGVRYEAVSAMLLNEFLKEHRKVQEQKAMIAQLKKDLQATAAYQQKQIEALTAGLQRVTADVELKQLRPRTVKNIK
jgi:hypothetical protein